MRKRLLDRDPEFDGFDHSVMAGAFSWRQRIVRRPKDAVGLLLISAASLAVVVNALFLQAGPHPAPIFANAPGGSAEATSSATSTSARARQAEISRPAPELPAVQAAKPGQAGKSSAAVSPASARHDPISELLEPSSRVVAVQRVLADFGYGQIKPTGIAGIDTRAAIEKFERERKLPVTGQISDRLTRELAILKGGPL